MRFRHRFAVGLASFLLFTGSVYAVVTSDGFVRRLVRSVVSRTFRGPAHFEAAAFTFRDGLLVHGLEIRDPSNPLGPPAIRVKTLHADFGLGVFGGGPRVALVELDAPEIRVTRRADGTLSVAGILQERDVSDASQSPPAVSITGGTFVFEDPSLLDGSIALRDVSGTVGPAGDSWRAEVRAETAELGPIHADAFLTPGGDVTASVKLGAVPLDPAVLARVRVPGASALPAVASQGTVRAHAAVAWSPGRAPVVTASADLAGVVTSLHLPGPGPDGAQTAPIRVAVTGGVAEFRDDSLRITGLEVEALGATLRFDRALVGGLAAGAVPTIEAHVHLTGLDVGPALTPMLPAGVVRVRDAFGLAARVDADIRVMGPLASPAIAVVASVSRGRVCFDGYVREDGKRQGFAWEVTDAAGSVKFVHGGGTEVPGAADGARTQCPTRVEFTVQGRHGTAKVWAKGSLDYGTGDEIPDVTIIAEDVPLDADLRAAFQDRAGRSFDRWAPSGTAARIDVRVVRDPHLDGPHGEATEITVHLDGRAGLQPKLLPARLRDVRGRIRIHYPTSGDHRAERVELTGVRAKGDGLSVRVDGRVDSDHAVGVDDLVVEIEADDLGGPLRTAVRESAEFVPQSVKDLFDHLGPRGPATVRAVVAGDPDRRRDRVIVAMRGMSVRGWRDVPLAAQDLTGTVTWEDDEVRLDAIEGTALGSRIRGRGILSRLSGPGVETDVVVEAADLPLGEPLRKALGPVAEKAAAFWDRLGPSREVADTPTRADVVLALRPSAHGEPVEVWLRRIRGTLRPAGLRFECGDGELSYDGHSADLRLDAMIGSAAVSLKRAHWDAASGRVEVEADATGLRFPQDVASLFSQDTAASIEAAFPSRVLHANGLKLLYDPRPERLDLSGELEIRPVSPDAEPGPGLEPDGAFRVSRFTFWFPPGLPVAFDGSFRADGFRIRPGVQIDDFRGTVALAGRIDPDGVEIGAETQEASLVAAGQPLTGATISAARDDRGTNVRIAAALHGGRVTARVGPARRPSSFAGELSLRDADLAKFAPGSSVKGIADGDVTFRSPTGDAADLVGSVEVRVREGDLVRYPLISAILNLIPGAGNLTDGVLSGNFEGPTVKLRDLVIDGPVLRLSGGRGRIGFDGSLDVTLKPGGILIGQIAFLTQSVVAVGGTIQQPDVRLKPFTSGN